MLLADGQPLGLAKGEGLWHFLNWVITGKDVMNLAQTVTASAGRLRPAVIQIDKGYEDPSGQTQANDKFPEGLALYAKNASRPAARAPVGG